MLLRVVLDTNNIVSGTSMPHGSSYEALETWRKDQFILLTSKALIKEVKRVLHYSRIQKKYHLTELEIKKVVRNLIRYAVVTPGEVKLNVIKGDPADNEVLACAVEGRADLIISGDKDLRELNVYGGIRIIGAQEFVKKILPRNM
jgi:putative PIN family toxin of toxin-antitoxin system